MVGAHIKVRLLVAQLKIAAVIDDLTFAVPDNGKVMQEDFYMEFVDQFR